MSINPKSVEFHQCHAKQHSICFFTTISKITKEIFAKIYTDSDLKVHALHYANSLNIMDYRPVVLYSMLNMEKQ